MSQILFVFELYSMKKSKVLKATEVAPKAYEPKVDVPDKEDDLQYDLGNLTAFDSHPLHSQVRILYTCYHMADTKSICMCLVSSQG